MDPGVAGNAVVKKQTTQSVQLTYVTSDFSDVLPKLVDLKQPQQSDYSFDMSTEHA